RRHLKHYRRPPRSMVADVKGPILEPRAGAAMASSSARPASSLFDIPIDLAQPAELLRTITGWATEGETRRVMYVNAHVVNQSRSTPGLGEALRRADLVYCDGYGVRLAARALKLPVP